MLECSVMEKEYTTPPVPNAFIWRRLHSFTGAWLALFLIEHLLTNSQAALLIGDDGSGFVRGVNFLKSLPYLPAIEIFLLGVPIAVHAIWGVIYLRTAAPNSSATDGSTPALPQYPRNRAYTWQRITSWILLIGIIGHVVQMRFVDYPTSAQRGTEHDYMVRLNLDEGLYTLAPRLGVKLYDKDQILLEKENADKAPKAWTDFFQSFTGLYEAPKGTPKERIEAQDMREQREWVAALEMRPLKEGQVIAVAPSFGTAELLVVRETFKWPLMIVLYTLFTLAACFHAYNGLWTFLISWGVTLTQRSQTLMRVATNGLMFLIAFMGMAAIWGSYWINLRY